MPISVSFSPGTPENVKFGCGFSSWGEKIHISMGRVNFLKEVMEDRELIRGK